MRRVQVTGASVDVTMNKAACSRAATGFGYMAKYGMTKNRPTFNDLLIYTERSGEWMVSSKPDQDPVPGACAGLTLISESMGTFDFTGNESREVKFLDRSMASGGEGMSREYLSIDQERECGARR